MALKTEKYRKYYLKCSNTFLAGCTMFPTENSVCETKVVCIWTRTHNIIVIPIHYSHFLKTFEQSWKVFMNSVCLSVFCSHKHSLNVLKFTYFILVCYKMFPTENSVCESKVVYRGTQNNSDTLWSMGKSILFTSILH